MIHFSTKRGLWNILFSYAYLVIARTQVKPLESSEGKTSLNRFNKDCEDAYVFYEWNFDVLIDCALEETIQTSISSFPSKIETGG